MSETTQKPSDPSPGASRLEHLMRVALQNVTLAHSHAENYTSEISHAARACRTYIQRINIPLAERKTRANEMLVPLDVTLRPYDKYIRNTFAITRLRTFLLITIILYYQLRWWALSTAAAISVGYLLWTIWPQIVASVGDLVRLLQDFTLW